MLEVLLRLAMKTFQSNLRLTSISHLGGCFWHPYMHSTLVSQDWPNKCWLKTPAIKKVYSTPMKLKNQLHKLTKVTRNFYFRCFWKIINKKTICVGIKFDFFEQKYIRLKSKDRKFYVVQNTHFWYHKTNFFKPSA